MNVLNQPSCTLSAEERAVREQRFATLAGRATSQHETAEGVCLVLPPEPSVAAEAAMLAVLEVACCPLSFRLDVRRDAVEFHVARR